MDISNITDVKELKSMAYDEMARVEQAQSNLRVLNERIATIAREESEKSEEEKTDQKG